MLNVYLKQNEEVNQILYMRGKNLRKKSEEPFIQLIKSLLLAKRIAPKLPKNIKGNFII
jgi:hypothetical protein